MRLIARRRSTIVGRPVFAVISAAALAVAAVAPAIAAKLPYAIVDTG